MGEPTPFLRWAGSKRKLVPHLAKYWNSSFKRYIEPFMGSAALFYAIKPRSAILGDTNFELINTFDSIKNHPRAVYNRLQKIHLGKDSYYQLREADPSNLDTFDRAARFIFLNRFCFNGLYRTNLSGKFNVPYAPARTGKLPNWDTLRSSSNLLQGAKLKQLDFYKLVKKHAKRDDFVYMDPPYATENTRVFRQYGPHVFGLSDLERLAKLLVELDNKKASFVVSYGWCPEARDLLKGWNTKKVFVQRNISGFSDSRRRAAEMLITNIET